MVNLLNRLHQSILAVCPIDGVAILDVVKHQIRVDYQAVATPEQRAAAQTVIDGFDWSDGAQKAFDDQARADAISKDPALQYALGQIKEASPNYEVPTKESISDALKESVALDSVSVNQEGE